MKSVLPMAGVIDKNGKLFAMVKCETNEEWSNLPQEAEIGGEPCRIGEWSSVEGICLYSIVE